jgi:hypothetical protein
MYEMMFVVRNKDCERFTSRANSMYKYGLERREGLVACFVGLLEESIPTHLELSRPRRISSGVVMSES